MKLHADAKQDAKLQATIRDWWKAVNSFLDKNYEAIEWDTYDAPKSLTLTQLKERGWGWTDKGNLVISAEKILGEKFFMTLRPTGEKHWFLAEHKHLKAPMLIFSVLKKPFSTVGLASRVTHTIFAHEVTHYLDELRTKGHKQSSSKKFDAGDLGAYFNDPYEYNAYYQEALTTIHSLLEMEEVPLDVKRTLLGSFEKFKAQILDKLGPVLLEHLNDRFKKKLIKRLHGFWNHYKEKLGGEMSFAAKVQAKYIGAMESIPESAARKIKFSVRKSEVVARTREANLQVTVEINVKAVEADAKQSASSDTDHDDAYKSYMESAKDELKRVKSASSIVTLRRDGSFEVKKFHYLTIKVSHEGKTVTDIDDVEFETVGEVYDVEEPEYRIVAYGEEVR